MPPPPPLLPMSLKLHALFNSVTPPPWRSLPLFTFLFMTSLWDTFQREEGEDKMSPVFLCERMETPNVGKNGSRICKQGYTQNN